jgi:hypothetical protein
MIKMVVMTMAIIKMPVRVENFIRSTFAVALTTKGALTPSLH